MPLPEQLKSPEGAARFFAFMEYPRDAIIEYLVDRCDCTEEEANVTVDEAVAKHRERKEQESQELGRGSRALAAEMDLSKSTWTEEV